jgi:hypothetical protein
VARLRGTLAQDQGWDRASCLPSGAPVGHGVPPAIGARLVVLVVPATVGVVITCCAPTT